VNHGRATAAEFAELMELVRQRVLERHGIELEPEVEIWAGSSQPAAPIPQLNTDS